MPSRTAMHWMLTGVSSTYLVTEVPHVMCRILPGRKREVLAFGCTFCFPVTRSVLGSGAVPSAVSSSCGDQSEMHVQPGKDVWWK